MNLVFVGVPDRAARRWEPSHVDSTSYRPRCIVSILNRPHFDKERSRIPHRGKGIKQSSRSDGVNDHPQQRIRDAHPRAWRVEDGGQIHPRAPSLRHQDWLPPFWLRRFLLSIPSSFGLPRFALLFLGTNLGEIRRPNIAINRSKQ